jgi:hypothetical protein
LAVLADLDVEVMVLEEKVRLVLDSHSLVLLAANRDYFLGLMQIQFQELQLSILHTLIKIQKFVAITYFEQEILNG